MLITTRCPLRAIDPGRLNVADAAHRVPPGNYSIIRRLPGGAVIAETADGRWFLAPAGSYIEHHRHHVPAQPVCQPQRMV